MSNKEYLDFVHEADSFVRKKDKEFLKKKVKKLKTYYRSVHKKEANDDPDYLVEIVKDALMIKNKGWRLEGRR